MHIEKKTLRNIFICVVSCIVLYWLLNETESVSKFFSVIYGIVSPFVLGAVLAFILNVPMRAFERKMGRISNARLRRAFALLLTVLIVLLVLTLVFFLLIPQLDKTFTDIREKGAKFFAENPRIKELFVKYTDFENLEWTTIVENVLGFFGMSFTTVVSSVFTAVDIVISALMNAVISVVFSVYCLFQKETLIRQGKKLLYAFVPEKIADQAVRIIKLTNVTFSNFLSGQCIEVCILGCMFAICMTIFRMPYVALISVVIALTAFIPMVGAWTGCACGAFLIFVNDPFKALIFVIMFVILQQIENNVIYPRVVGTSIGISGMWVLVAVAIGGSLFGVIGMFLMIPVAAVIHTVLREITDQKLEEKEIDPDKYTPAQRKKRRRKRPFDDDTAEEQAGEPEGKTE